MKKEKLKHPDNPCNRCGECCSYFKDGIKKKCRYLKKLGDHLYHCSVYGSRLGKVVDKLEDGYVVCIMRCDDARLFDGCPYNKVIEHNLSIKDE